MQTLIAKLYLLRTSEGGRKTPIVSGYRPAFYIADRQTDGAITLLGRTEQVPGETSDVRVKLLHPKNFGALLVVGAHFEIREGPKTVGRGTVLKICD